MLRVLRYFSKAQGIKWGRPAIQPEVVQRVNELIAKGLSFSAIGREVHLLKSELTSFASK